jgi:small subunit ribosomal protein S1
LEGLVTNLTKFGVFVDLGGVEGLIHISELSWGRVVDPNDICELGQRLQVLVLDVHPEKSRIALSLKRLEENPWEIISEKYFVNQIVTARITGLVPYGAFARLEDGVEGLIHSSEFPLNNGNVSDLPLKIGQDVCVKILLINTRQHKLSLSLKI